MYIPNKSYPLPHPHLQPRNSLFPIFSSASACLFLKFRCFDVSKMKEVIKTKIKRKRRERERERESGKAGRESGKGKGDGIEEEMGVVKFSSTEVLCDW